MAESDGPVLVQHVISPLSDASQEPIEDPDPPSGVLPSILLFDQNAWEEEEEARVQEEERRRSREEGLVKEPDMTKPLLWQVACMDGGLYNDWVHSAHVFTDGRKHAPLFGHPLLEACTRTPWWVVPLLWLPVSAWLMAPYLLSSPSPLEVLAILLLALALWTLTEYSVHRFLFHFDHYNGVPDFMPLRVLHFLLHGLHHKTPSDPYRLVLPPVLSSLLIPTAWYLYRTLFANMPGEAFRFMFGAGLVGYVAYDTMHYMLHHAPAGPAAWQHMVRLHARHHALGGHEAAGFGITSPLWDWVMATTLHLKKV